MAFTGPGDQGFNPGAWLNQRIARPSFQDWASRMPFLGWMARRDGAELFDIVQGFVRSQILFALVQLDLPQRLMTAPATAEALALADGIDAERMTLLLRAGVGLGLLKRRRDGRFSVTRQGAALCGVPGLTDMILHHGAFYRDMTDPLALLKGEVDTELARFWPYVFGASGAVDPKVTDKYSELMADTQSLVAKDTLRTVPFDGITRLMDVGGGTGAFLTEVAQAYPDMKLDLFDLPTVSDAAKARIARMGLSARIDLHAGSFRDDPLPKGADAISLVRVLYDHSEDTVAHLLRKVFETLPPGGRLIISEPMSGGNRPDPVTDVYFAFYTLAMRTGKVRSADEITQFLRASGFAKITAHGAKRSYVTSAISAVKPD